jgi:hypothetical protein
MAAKGTAIAWQLLPPDLCGVLEQGVFLVGGAGQDSSPEQLRTTAHQLIEHRTEY